jgi:hypothetical protein
LDDEEVVAALLDEDEGFFFNRAGVAASMKTVMRTREMRMI